MEEKNENSNEYTGEYGNSVEGSASSLYSYSYREHPEEATRSGDYYAAEQNNAAKEDTDGDTAGSSSQDREFQSSQSAGSQSAYTQYDDSGLFTQSSAGQSNRENTFSYTEETGTGEKENQPKEKKLTGKKIAVCAACAVLFGLVAGICFQAVAYFSGHVLGINQNSGKQIGYTSDSVNYTQASTSSAIGTGDVSAIVDNSMPSIVAITSKAKGQDYYDFFGQYYQGGETASSGSGFIVGKNDTELLIATNNHVIEGADSISVQFIDGEVYEATAKGTDSSADLAVVAVKLSALKDKTMESIKIARLGDSSEVKVGEMAIAIGNALGYGQSVTVGYISAKNREITETSENGEVGNTIKVIQTDAAINPGNSGGALLNIRGEVIGINSAKIADSQVEGVGYAIPISEADPIIDELMNKEVLTDKEKGYLGISGRTVSEEATSFNMPNGVYVSEVAEGGAAEKAGILSGDIITAVNGVTVTNIESLQQKVTSYRKGTEITLTVRRLSEGEYAEQEITVTLQGEESLDSLPQETSSSSEQPDTQVTPNPEEGSDGSFGFGDLFPFGY